GVVSYGDYFSVGRHVGGGTSNPQLHFEWHGAYDKTFLFGGAGVRDSGHLELKATHSGSSANYHVPHVIIDNKTIDGTTWSGVRVYVGRDNRSPSTSNFRSGFEIWQYRGDGSGSMNLLFDVDTNDSGVKYIDTWVDMFWVKGDYRSPGSIDIDGGLTTGATSNFYGNLNMQKWDITNVGNLHFGYERPWQFSQFNSGPNTALGLYSLIESKSFIVADPQLYTVLEVRVGANGDGGEVKVFGNFHVTGSKNALVQ